MRRFPLLLVLFVMLACTPFAEACGPFRGFFQRVFSGVRGQSCGSSSNATASCDQTQSFQATCTTCGGTGVTWTVPAQGQQQFYMVPATVAPQPQAAPKTKVVWVQSCSNGVCRLIPTTVPDDSDAFSITLR